MLKPTGPVSSVLFGSVLTSSQMIPTRFQQRNQNPPGDAEVHLSSVMSAPSRGSGPGSGSLSPLCNAILMK